MDEDVEKRHGSVRRRTRELRNERTASEWGFVSECSKAIDEVGVGVGKVRIGGEYHGLNVCKSYLC